MLEQLAAVGKAVKDYTPMTDIPFIEGWKPGTVFNITENTPAVIFNGLFELAIQIGGMLAVFMFIRGGLQIITARDAPGKVTEGKTKMTNAVLGLLLLLSTTVVLNTINPEITDLNAFDKLGALPVPKSTLPSVSKGLGRDFDTGTDYDKNVFCTAVNSPYGRDIRATDAEVEKCKQWVAGRPERDKKKAQDKYSEDIAKAVATEDSRYCPDKTSGLLGIFGNSGLGCYLDSKKCQDNNSGKTCGLSHTYKNTVPVLDGPWRIRAGAQYEPDRYSNEDVCKAVAKERALAKGGTATCEYRL